jgi:hypothetical protein
LFSIKGVSANWGEVRAGAFDRLELISQCTAMPEEPTTIVRLHARERALAAKADADRGAKITRIVDGTVGVSSADLILDGSIPLIVETGEVCCESFELSAF